MEESAKLFNLQHQAAANVCRLEGCFMQYAIVDIETTGGYAAGSGITEIAIIIHDGKSIIDRFETLVNPECPIPVYIQSLTGIDPEMVAQSPVFATIAERVHSLLSGRIFVAHNVNFDYSFIKHHLDAAGYPFQANKLCTVRLSRKIRPGLRSYSLGRLCEELGIVVHNRHRAGGDADATAILFSRLIGWDSEGHIAAMLKKNSKDQALPPNLPRADFEALPETPGVYYFKDQAGKVIYVGKAKNLRKRVATHFTGHNPNAQRQGFLQYIHAIGFEKCGTEMMALLLEASEIKKLWPRFNRALKRYEPKFGLYLYEDRNNYLRLAVGKHSGNQLPVHEFDSIPEGNNILHKLVRRFGLCTELCMIGPCTGNCATAGEQHTAEETNIVATGTSSCSPHRDAVAYNEQVLAAVAHLKQQLPTFALLDKGRHDAEQSCIWVEKGVFYGMGYIDRDSDLQQPGDIKSLLTPYPSNQYILGLIYTYAERYPYKVVRPIPEQSLQD
jgi:DNA polymerase-3 subunit epsilon